MLKRLKTIKVHERMLRSGFIRNRNIFEVFNHIVLLFMSKMLKTIKEHERRLCSGFFSYIKVDLSLIQSLNQSKPQFKVII